MRRNLVRGLLVLSLAVNAAVAFHALRGARMRAEGGMAAEPPLFQRVQLDARQRELILDRRAKLMRTRAETSARLLELRGELAVALAQGEAGRPRIDAVLAELERAQREFQRSVVEHLLGVRETLTPAQRPAFEALLGDRLRAGGMMQPDGIVPAGRGGGGK